MSGRPVRFGIVGTGGSVRERVLPALHDEDACVPVSVASGDPARAREVARAFGMPRHHRSVGELVADPDIDAVYVGTVNERHAEIVLAAARHGKHVLCEKPLALDAGDARAMVAECARREVVLATNHHLRASAPVRAMRDAVAAGVAGDPVLAHAAMALLLPPALHGWRLSGPGAGVALDLGVHVADALRFVLGDEVEAVGGFAAPGRIAGAGVEDTFAGTLRFARGTLATFAVSFCASDTTTSLSVSGTDGTLVARDVLTQDAVGTVELVVGGRARAVAVHAPEDLYRCTARAFARAVCGRGLPLATGEDGLAALEITLAALAAARRGPSVPPAAPPGSPPRGSHDVLAAPAAAVH